MVARLMQACIVEPLDEPTARAIGILLAKAGTSDVVDGAVVEGAARRGDAVVTSDVDDIARLIVACGTTVRVLPV
jgi:uncharacterized protein YaiI (UPF0178 family)